MKKRILSILLCCVMLVGLLPTAAFAEGSTAPADITGSGASDDPYLIYTAEGLKAFHDKVNGQNGLTKQPGAHAKLMNDIVLNDGTFDENGSWSEDGTPDKWEPIGSSSNPYKGTFDGDGKTISGLYITGERVHAGLFGITEGATIKNVTVDGYVSASGGDDSWFPCTGGIVGAANNTRIENCTNLSIVKSDFTKDGGSNYVGGIAGNLNGGTISNCRNGGKVILEVYNGEVFCAGGIVGSSNGQVSSCYNTGTVIVHSNNNAQVRYLIVGGVVGTNGSGAEFKSCYNTGAVTVTGDFTARNANQDGAGGVVGLSNTPVSKCYNTGKVSCDNGNVNVGSVVGVNYDTTVTNCYFLKDSATNGVGSTVDLTGGTTENTVAYTMAKFADGTVLNELKNNETTNEWGDNGYLAAAGLTIPLLSWQTADTGHTCTPGAVLGQCDCGVRIADGTEQSPYEIYTAEHLKQFRDKVNGGDTAICAKLMNDIVLNDGTFDKDGNWSEDGTPNKWTPINGYAGTFDGNGYTIKGLYVKDEGNAGLFGKSTSRDGTIKNVTVTGYVEGTEYVGGIMGFGGQTIIGCTNAATVKGIGACVVGGIAGRGEMSPVKNCVNLGSILLEFNTRTDFNSNSAGIMGYSFNATITDCYNVGSITAVDSSTSSWNDGYPYYYIAGILGSGNYDPSAQLSNCYNVGTVTYRGVESGYVRGIMGLSNTWFVKNCYWLEGTAELGIGDPRPSSYAAAKSKAEFADGTVLELLKNNRTDSPWADECQYVAAAGMTLPVFKGQGDNHTHSEKTGNCLDGIYCECGYLMHGATSGHNWGKWEHNTTSHTRGCDNPGCGMTQSGNCSGGTATCTEQAVCEVCHEKYGNKDPNNHTDTTEWIQTETKHTQKYKCCGAVTVAEEDHEWENGVCTECHYACAHSGGTATCTDKAVCEICGEKYGAVDPDNHTDITEWIQTETKHTQKCKCCGAVTVAEEDHEWENGVCTECHYACAHTGGTATCTDKAVCEICGESYGELNANNHADMKHIEAKAATKTAEGNTEYWHCEDCGKYFADKDGTKEITKADTVTAKLPEKKPTSPKTGDNSNLALWITLLFVSGGAVAATIVYGRKKKRGVK